jgi:CheY-like chemotaxis protein
MCRKKVLFVDDDPTLIESLQLRCETLGLNVITASDAVEAIGRSKEHLPDLVCLDIHIPWGNGWQVCERLLADKRLSHSHVIILTGDIDEATIVQCKRMKVHYVHKGTDLWSKLGPMICELLEVPLSKLQDSLRQWQSVAEPPVNHLPTNTGDPSEDLFKAIFEVLKDMPASDVALVSKCDPPWVLCIDDDEDYSLAMKMRLESHGVATVRAFEGTAGFRSLFRNQADLILLDYELPNGRGDYILERLKNNVVTRDIPVIVVTGRRDLALERRLLAMGAASYITKPPDFEMLLQEMAKHIPVLLQSAEC